MLGLVPLVLLCRVVNAVGVVPYPSVYVGHKLAVWTSPVPTSRRLSWALDWPEAGVLHKRAPPTMHGKSLWTGYPWNGPSEKAIKLFMFTVPQGTGVSTRLHAVGGGGCGFLFRLPLFRRCAWA